MISSRKQPNVDKAVESLRKQHGTESVSGVICHVGKDEDRKRLMKEVREDSNNLGVFMFKVKSVHLSIHLSI